VLNSLNQLITLFFIGFFNFYLTRAVTFSKNKNQFLGSKYSKKGSLNGIPYSGFPIAIRRVSPATIDTTYDWIKDQPEKSKVD
jgi:putative alpha-1,2-mannosidase